MLSRRKSFMRRVFTLTPRSFGSNTYFVTDGSEAFVVDPSVGVAEARAVLGADFLPPSTILITHGHFDHVEKLPEWYSAFGCRVCIGREDAPMLSSGYLNASEFFFHEDRRYFVPHETLAEGDALTLLGERVAVYSFPGHSPGSLVYCLSDIAFVGDLVFAGGGYGRYDLPGGSGTVLFDSLRRAQSLLSGLLLYPGHGETLTL